MFKRFNRHEITLNRVHDSIRIREGDESLTLRVESDPLRMVAGIMQAQKMLQAIDENSTEEQKQNAARYFAEVIFGKAQADKLLAFYLFDAACVINVCGRYFAERLSKKIDKAQRRAGIK